MTDTNNVEKHAEDQTVWDFTPTPNPSTNIAGDTIDSPEKWGALQEIRRVGQTEANKHLREAAKYQYAIHLIDVATGKRSPQFYYPIVGRGKGKDTGAKQDFYHGFAHHARERSKFHKINGIYVACKEIAAQGEAKLKEKYRATLSMIEGKIAKKEHDYIRRQAKWNQDWLAWSATLPNPDAAAAGAPAAATATAAAAAPAAASTPAATPTATMNADGTQKRNASGGGHRVLFSGSKVLKTSATVTPSGHKRVVNDNMDTYTMPNGVVVTAPPGKHIVLYDDGTWDIVDTEQKMAPLSTSKTKLLSAIKESGISLKTGAKILSAGAEGNIVRGVMIVTLNVDVGIGVTID